MPNLQKVGIAHVFAEIRRGARAYRIDALKRDIMETRRRIENTCPPRPRAWRQRKTRIRDATGRVITTYYGIPTDEIVDVSRRKTYRQVLRETIWTGSRRIPREEAFASRRSLDVDASVFGRRPVWRLDANYWIKRVGDMTDSDIPYPSNWRLTVRPERGTERHTKRSLSATHGEDVLTRMGFTVEDGNVRRDTLSGAWERTYKGYQCLVGKWRLTLTPQMVGGVTLNGDVRILTPHMVTEDSGNIRRVYTESRIVKPKINRVRVWRLAVYHGKRSRKVVRSPMPVSSSLVDSIREAEARHAETPDATPHDAYLCGGCEACDWRLRVRIDDMDTEAIDARKAMIASLSENFGLTPESATMLLPT